MNEIIATIIALGAPVEYAVCHTEECTNPTILPHCEMEDSRNCMWDARWRGNGLGRSFYDINGQVFYIDLSDDGINP